MGPLAAFALLAQRRARHEWAGSRADAFKDAVVERARALYLGRRAAELDAHRLVVQRYVDRPYLLDGHKFDLRLYVVVTSLAPLRVYAYGDGLLRFCVTPYAAESEADLADARRHLTNTGARARRAREDAPSLSRPRV